VKIGHKLQSLGKISYILAADPPPSSFRSIPTLGVDQVLVVTRQGTYSNTVLSKFNVS